MLVLSAIVTLMSVDAAHRVHHQPNLFFCLVLVLESGLFGSFTALNFFHWFLFWEISLIPAFFLIKLWGGHGEDPQLHNLCLYNGGFGCAAGFLSCSFSLYGTMDLANSPSSPRLAHWSRWLQRTWAGDDLACDWSTRRVCRQGSHDAVSYMVAGCLR